MEWRDITLRISYSVTARYALSTTCHKIQHQQIKGGIIEDHRECEMIIFLRVRHHYVRKGALACQEYWF